MEESEESILAMPERKRDQLTTASAISAWRAASKPLRSRRKHFGGSSCSEIPLRGEQKANIIVEVPSVVSDVHDHLYGSVCSLKRVRRIEAAVA